MTRSSRLRRLVEAQVRLRTLEQLGLGRCRQALAEAEVARNHVLRSVSGAGSADQAWIVARTDASRRTARRVEAAVALVLEQEARLMERATVCQLVTRLHSEAVRQECARREANELAEVLERVVISVKDSVGQD
jgi:hypothetical protein